MDNRIKLFFLFLFLVAIDSYRCKYSKLTDINFAYNDVWHNTNIDINTKYVYFGQTSDISGNDIKLMSVNIESAIIKYGSLNGYPIVECRPINTLELFYIDKSILNDRIRFSGFTNNNINKNVVIWGLYDPIINQSKYAALVISNPGAKKAEETLAHELFHYWYDRFCWEAHIIGTAEDAALNFQTFYEINYMEKI